MKLFGKKDEELIEKELAKYTISDDEEYKEIEEKTDATINNELFDLEPIETSIKKEFVLEEENKPQFSLDDDFDEVFSTKEKVEPTTNKVENNEEDGEYVYEYYEPHYAAKAIIIGVIALLIGVFGAFALFKEKAMTTYKEAYIQQGYMLTNTANATEADIRVGKTAYVNGKLITGTYIDIDTTKATATPSDILKGYTAYVNGQLITGTIPTYKGQTTITPSTKNVTIPAGYYVTTPIIIVGDQNLLSKNIKENITIFDVKGICKGQ